MSTAAPRDPYLDLPLDGVRLIEASAGTGKTFTLATLVTRLVVERGLRVGQILAVTFTEAATQELRKRIRERLERAAVLVEGMPDTPTDSGESAEDRLSRDIIARHLAASDESAARLARRLHRAVLEIDLAAIFTIHGFCARVLREHALESGQGFAPQHLLTSDADLREELAADLWRVFAAADRDAELLERLWRSPGALAVDLRALLQHDDLRPHRPRESDDPLPALQAAAAGLCAAFVEHGDVLRADIETAIADKVLHNGIYKPALVDALWRDLRAWCAKGDATAPLDARIDRLTRAVLLDKTSKAGQGRTPDSPLCAAVDVYLMALQARRDWLDERTIDLLHRVRDAGRLRLRQLKQVRGVQTYDDLIDGVAFALEGPHGDALAAQLRAQYHCALVDEFQDTDARQWSIFQRVFGDAAASPALPGDAPALFLIGDPKQAIYRFRGGDVHTYLAAAKAAMPAPPLDRNFRSRPGVLRAIGALYAQAGEAAFVEPRIRFRAVEPAGRHLDADFMRHGAPAPALTVRVIERSIGQDQDQAGAAGVAGAWKADASRERATGACVAAIHALLSDAREGRAAIEGEPVQPGDIAVLVRRHHEATRIQRALSAVGIPAVAAGRQSLFATDEARDLRAVFEALLQPADESRLRAALATVLLGVDAAGIDAIDHDDTRRSQVQLDALAWRERWQRSGPLALVSDLCAAQAGRLLGLLDGERRLTNYLQLGELLQEADVRALGLHGLVDWLRQRMADADDNDESQLLRLESDARRVQIVTLHKSKGLEYPLVFLPFAGIGGSPSSTSRHCAVHEDDGRVLHWKIDKDERRWQDALAEARREDEAEEARLLYVGLTRARQAVWLATGAFYNADKTRLAPMLADLDALHGHPDIVVETGAVASPAQPFRADGDVRVPEARTPQRVVPRDWWVYSFTQLAHAEGAGEHLTVAFEERGASDEPAGAPDDALIEHAFIEGSLIEDAAVAGAASFGVASFDRRFSGSRFGNVLHDALEHVDFARWRDWHGDSTPDGQAEPLRAALRAGGYPDDDLDDGLALLGGLVGHTLTVDLPEGGRLAALPAASRRAEMEFHFALAPTSVDALLSLLHAHGVVPDRHGFGQRRRLEGLMTGKIDLTYTVDGRWYLLDYKSNRLPAYDRAGLDAAMRHSEYDLQALIYTLALHRWLRFRLGDGYDYRRDFGGVRYLFCRGLAAGDGHGVHAHVPDAALVEAMDALFGATSPSTLLAASLPAETRA